MEPVEPLLIGLEQAHQERLVWFRDRAGTISNFPEPLRGGLLLASKGKAIYKPADLNFALSVRIMLESPYQDGEVFTREDGSWCVAYHQEVDKRQGEDAEIQRSALWTNRSIDACIESRVPVGVMKEIEPLTKSGRSRYLVLGLALPVGWADGMYLLEGFGPSGADLSQDTGIDVLEAAALRDPELQQELDSPTPPKDEYDARVRVMRQIVARRGQRQFRGALMTAYEGRCAVTGCDVVDVLEAAHIESYRGPESNRTANGLLLRADIHTLFDLQLLAVEPLSLRVRVARRLLGSQYEDLNGRLIALPAAKQDAPLAHALATTFARFLEAERVRDAEAQDIA